MPSSSKSPWRRTPTWGKTGWKPSSFPLAGGRQPFWRVHRLRPEELDQAAALEAACFSHPWSRRTLEAELQNPTAVFYAACMGGRVAGYAGLHQVLDEGYIDNVAVFPAFRRRGVAGRLVGRLCAHARQEKLQFLTLEVRESNRGALALYQKWGFTQVGRRPRFYDDPQEDALLLTRYF